MCFLLVILFHSLFRGWMYSQQAEMKGMKRQMCNVYVHSLNKTKLCCYRCSVFMGHKNIEAPHDHLAHTRLTQSSTDLVWKNLALHPKSLNESLQAHTLHGDTRCKKFPLSLNTRN